MTAHAPVDGRRIAWPVGMGLLGSAGLFLLYFGIVSWGDTLDFDVSLQTHRVDLSMDVAALSTLKTDTGVTVKGSAWDGPKGGHHVMGKVSFPASQDGKSILQGAKP